jgi:hypothetical protein
MTASTLHSLPQQLGVDTPCQVCRASSLQPPNNMEQCSTHQKMPSTVGSSGLPSHSPVQPVVQLGQQLQQLRLKRLFKGDPDHSGYQSDGGSSSTSQECCSSSSSSDMSAPAGQQAEDVPSSSAAADSQQGDEAGAEPLLRDNPDRFTLSPIQ